MTAFCERCRWQEQCSTWHNDWVSQPNRTTLCRCGFECPDHELRVAVGEVQKRRSRSLADTARSLDGARRVFTFVRRPREPCSLLRIGTAAARAHRALV